YVLFISMIRPPPQSTLLPYTTLFRSLRKIVKDLTSRDVSIKFTKENLTFDNQVSPMSNLLLSVMGAFAEFERSLIKERQREGIEDRKSTRLNSSHVKISYAVFCLKKK